MTISTSLHLILKTKGICNGLHISSFFFGILNSIFDKTSWSVVLWWAHYRHLFSNSFCSSLDGSYLCFTRRAQSLKEVMIPVFFFFSFSFIAAGLRLQLWWFKLVIFVVAVAVCFIFGEYFSMLRSKWFVCWVGSLNKKLLSIIYKLLSPAVCGRFPLRHVPSYFIQFTLLFTS